MLGLQSGASKLQTNKCDLAIKNKHLSGFIVDVMIALISSGGDLGQCCGFRKTKNQNWGAFSNIT
jgi:hypothetical protein